MVLPSAGAAHMTSISRRWRMYRGIVLWMAAMLVLPAVPLAAAEQLSAEAARTQAGAVFVCGSIDAGKPQGRAVVFSASQGTVHCYSDFIRVGAPEQITHAWFFRDREVAQFKLTIQPPRWSSYSSLKIPSDHKGPWRVDVTGQDGVLYGTARFSIVD